MCFIIIVVRIIIIFKIMTLLALRGSLYMRRMLEMIPINYFFSGLTLSIQY